jgi:hypothetical protein
VTTVQLPLCSADSCRALPNINLWQIPWWHGRSLQQRARPGGQGPGGSSTNQGMPMCMWNEVKEFCSPSQMVFLSMDAPPSTVLHRWADKP